MTLMSSNTQTDTKPEQNALGFSLPRTVASRIGIVDDALRVEKYLYTSLVALTSRQMHAIELQDTNLLLRVLTERQTVVDKLVAQHKCFKPYRNVWDQLVDGFDESTRARIEKSIDELRTMAEQVADADEKAAETLKSRKSAVQEELLGAQKTRTALNAYGNKKTGNTARFQDTQA